MAIPATIAFDFVASSAFEISVNEGDEVNVIEEDDGSGWIKVINTRGKSGLVPASYVQLKEDSGPPPIAASTRPKTTVGSGQFVRALYDYEAQGADELALSEGQRIELSAGPAGGQNYGDGWWEGHNPSTGKKGIFPSNYVELA